MLIEIASAIALIVLTQWLLVIAWLSQSPNRWQYILWAALVILLWGQPWNSADPYHTRNPRQRALAYLLCFCSIGLATYFYDLPGAILLLLEISLLFMIERWGNSIIERRFK